MKRFYSLFLALVTIVSLTSCAMPVPPSPPPVSSGGQSDVIHLPAEEETELMPEDGPPQEALPPETSSVPEIPESPVSEELPPESHIQIEVQSLDPDGFYYDLENVVLYLITYDRLPSNYITKNEARALGWEGGSVEQFQEGAAIGGDRFGNREGLLPQKDGRVYTECDLDTNGAKSRGAKRLVFSNDDLYFYTEDHYETFAEVKVDENNQVILS